MSPGESIFEEKPAKRLKRGTGEEAAAAAEIDPEEAWSLVGRQPWADKEVAPAVLNEEQKAYLEQIAKEKAEKAAEEAPEGAKVTLPPRRAWRPAGAPRSQMWGFRVLRCMMYAFNVQKHKNLQP